MRCNWCYGLCSGLHRLWFGSRGPFRAQVFANDRVARWQLAPIERVRRSQAEKFPRVRPADIDMERRPNGGAGELKIIAAILRGEPGRKRS